MMKMATGEGLPPPAGCRNGSRLVFGGYRGLRRRNSRSILFPDRFRVYGYIYRRKKYVKGATRGPRGWRARLGGWARPLPRALLVDPLTCTPSLPDCFLSKNNFSEGFIPFGLRLIFLFCETLKQWKTQTGTGLWVNRLVPKVI